MLAQAAQCRRLEQCFRQRILVKESVVCTYSRFASLKERNLHNGVNTLPVYECTTVVKSNIQESVAYNFFKTTMDCKSGARYSIVAPLEAYINAKTVEEIDLDTSLGVVLMKLRIAYPTIFIACFCWNHREIKFDAIATVHVNARATPQNFQTQFNLIYHEESDIYKPLRVVYIRDKNETSIPTIADMLQNPTKFLTTISENLLPTLDAMVLLRITIFFCTKRLP